MDLRIFLFAKKTCNGYMSSESLDAGNVLISPYLKAECHWVMLVRNDRSLIAKIHDQFKMIIFYENQKTDRVFSKK